MADCDVVGLTTENAHIFRAGDPALGMDDAVGAIRQFMSGFAYEESGDADDRVFTLLEHPSWLSIYDTETGLLDDLVRSLSKTLGAHVAAIRVEDSDKYSARLCRAGRWVDKISASVLRKKGSGKPDLWADVLAAGSRATFRAPCKAVARLPRNRCAICAEPWACRKALRWARPRK